MSSKPFSERKLENTLVATSAASENP